LIREAEAEPAVIHPRVLWGRRSWRRRFLAGIVLICATQVSLVTAQQTEQEPVREAAEEAAPVEGGEPAEDSTAGQPPADADKPLRFRDNGRETPVVNPIAYLLVIVLAVALLFAAIAMRRRLLSRIGVAGDGRIKVEERKRISMQTYVTVLQIDGKKYVLAETANGVALNRLEEKQEEV
jgi:hypothetical protein